MSQISLAIADDHKLLRNGLAQLLRAQGFEMLIEVNNGAELLDELKHKQVDVAILDINMPVMDGFTAAQEIRKLYPKIKMLALSMFDDDISVIKMLRSGVKGYLLKDAEPDELRKAIHEVHQHDFYYSELVNNNLLPAKQKIDEYDPEISEREIEFLKLICTDLTYKEIAIEMCVSPRTIDGYRDQLFEKLGLKSRTALVIFAIKNHYFLIG